MNRWELIAADMNDPTHKSLQVARRSTCTTLKRSELVWVGWRRQGAVSGVRSGVSVKSKMGNVCRRCRGRTSLAWGSHPEFNISVLGFIDGHPLKGGRRRGRGPGAPTEEVQDKRWRLAIPDLPERPLVIGSATRFRRAALKAGHYDDGCGASGPAPMPSRLAEHGRSAEGL